MSDERPQRPTSDDDRAGWSAYWTAQGMPWRMEPEIAPQRQAFLAKRRAITPDIEHDIYPFKGIKPALTRADIEWLLATHISNGMQGPVDWNDEKQRMRLGLDLRGAVLNHLDLSSLPLTRMCGGLAIGGWDFDGYYRYTLPALGKTYDALLTKIDKAAMHLQGAILSGVQLQGAMLRGVHMEEAILHKANLQGADLVAAHLEGAELYGVHLEDAWLADAHLEESAFYSLSGGFPSEEGAHLQRSWLVRASCQGATLMHAHLEGSTLSEAHFEGAWLSEAHAEGAWVWKAHFERVVFHKTYLEGAWLAESRFEEAIFSYAHLERVTFGNAHLEKAALDNAHLSGSWFTDAHLEGANLSNAHCEGTRISHEDEERIRIWQPHMTQVVPPTNFSGAYFDTSTNLRGIILFQPKHEGVWLADVRWGGVNLAVVNWSGMRMLGDEFDAKQRKTEEGLVKNAGVLQANYEAAVRANRQLATALRDQGLNEKANAFAYRAHQLQRVALRRQKKFIQYVWSLFLELLAGYGYEPIRTVFLYLGVIFAFAARYQQLAPQAHLRLSFMGAVIMSIAAFHGRGFFPTPNLPLDSPLTIAGALEAVFGLIIEASFIATFTQRYFGK